MGRPTWLIGMHGMSEVKARSAAGTKVRPVDFVPCPIALKNRRGRLQDSLPSNCDLVRELTWMQDNHLYTLWLAKKDGEWVVFDSDFQHEDLTFDAPVTHSLVFVCRSLFR